MPRAVHLTQPREAVHVVEIPLPAPAPGEVRVRIEACALGQLDWNLLTLDAPPRLPLVPGHEAVGIVETPGAHLAVGQRVLITPLAGSCGECVACRRHDARLCAKAVWRGMHVDGVLATHVVVPEASLHALPALSELVELKALWGDDAWGKHGPARHLATLALCGGSMWTAVGALNSLELSAPSRVAVFGIGGVGHLAVQAARAAGHEVFAMDVDPDRVALALELGAKKLDGTVDAAIVCTPSTQAVQQAVRLLRAGGRVALAGSSPTGRLDLSVADLVWRGLTLRAGLLGTKAELEEGVGLVLAKKVTPRFEVIGLDDVPARLWALRDLGFPGRLVVVM